MACKDGRKDTGTLEIYNKVETGEWMDWSSCRAGQSTPGRSWVLGVSTGCLENEVSEAVRMNRVKGTGESC